MTLNEALQIINGSRTSGPTRTLFLACGFQPLHLATFFQAHAILRLHGDGFQPLHLATLFQAHAILRLHGEQVRVETGRKLAPRGQQCGFTP